MTTLQHSGFAGFKAVFPSATDHMSREWGVISGSDRHRIYSLAFWMTDNELAAEEIAAAVFEQAIHLGATSENDVLDRLFLAAIDSLTPIGKLTLQCALATEELSIRRNTKRVHLERAVVQLPPTERLIFVMHDVDGYNRTKVAELLGIGIEDCALGLHQARLRLRELVAAMVR
jgi:RNA polymerase sigma-70 factor, ECF subfamily